MRKYFLPSALILILGLGLAVGQNINKALQLSQDPTGAFGVDTNNNVYFPGHVLSNGPGTPVLSGTLCAGTPVITGTDTVGVVTDGAASGGCTMTFNRAYLSAPYCLVTTPTTTTVNYTASTTSLIVTHATNTNVTWNYFCSGSR